MAAPAGPPGWFWNDAWDGYPEARRRLLNGAIAAGLSNPVFVTGDWHSTFVNDLKLDFQDAASPTIATELVTPAITTGGDGTPYGPDYAPMIPHNPHIRYYEGDRRGYFKATLTPQHLRLDVRFVTTVESRVAARDTRKARGSCATVSPAPSPPNRLRSTRWGLEPSAWQSLTSAERGSRGALESATKPIRTGWNEVRRREVLI